MNAIDQSLIDLQRWMAWAQSEPTREEVLWLLEDSDAGFEKDLAWEYFIFESASGDLVGMTGLKNSNTGNHALEVSYWVRSDRSGQGYATMAAAAMVELALTVDKIKRVEIRMDAANIASASIPAKLGFELARTENVAIRAKAHTGRELVWQRWLTG